jgi:hypothetical protein
MKFSILDSRFSIAGPEAEIAAATIAGNEPPPTGTVSPSARNRKSRIKNRKC